MLFKLAKRNHGCALYIIHKMPGAARGKSSGYRGFA